MPNTARYAFHNMPAHLSPLETFLDPITQAELDEISIGEGWHCLDLAAGGGSVTRMLSEAAGQTGRVTAIDQDTHMLTGLPNVDIYQQDMDKRDPLPVSGPFDLIHARLLTHHLAHRREVVSDLAAVLRPGGWMLLGEFIATEPKVMSAPSEADAGIFRRVMQGLYDALGADGIDLAWGECVHGAMQEAKLESVRTRWYAETWVGGTYGCMLARNNVTQKRDQIAATGVPLADIDRFTQTLMEDPAMAVRSHMFCSIRGRRPE
jgi:SAM-dependent methyltransferase